MKLRFILLISAIASRVVSAPLDQSFAEGWFINTIRTITNEAQILSQDTNGIAIGAGGNAGVYPDPSSPFGTPPQAQVSLGGQTTTVYLAQSSFGQMTAGPLGFPDSPSVLISDGFKLLT